MAAEETSDRIISPQEAVDESLVQALVKRINEALPKGERRFPVPPGYRERIEQMMREAGWPVIDRDKLEPTAYGFIIVRS